jgi:hypothetical protein
LRRSRRRAFRARHLRASLAAWPATTVRRSAVVDQRVDFEKVWFSVHDLFPLDDLSSLNQGVELIHVQPRQIKFGDRDHFRRILEAGIVYVDGMAIDADYNNRVTGPSFQ